MPSTPKTILSVIHLKENTATVDEHVRTFNEKVEKFISPDVINREVFISHIADVAKKILEDKRNRLTSLQISLAKRRLLKGKGKGTVTFEFKGFIDNIPQPVYCSIENKTIGIMVLKQDHGCEGVWQYHKNTLHAEQVV